MKLIDDTLSEFLIERCTNAMLSTHYLTIAFVKILPCALELKHLSACAVLFIGLWIHSGCISMIWKITAVIPQLSFGHLVNGHM